VLANATTACVLAHATRLCTNAQYFNIVSHFFLFVYKFISAQIVEKSLDKKSISNCCLPGKLCRTCDDRIQYCCTHFRTFISSVLLTDNRSRAVTALVFITRTVFGRSMLCVFARLSRLSNVYVCMHRPHFYSSAKSHSCSLARLCATCLPIIILMIIIMFSLVCCGCLVFMFMFSCFFSLFNHEQIIRAVYTLSIHQLLVATS
jgi:hypothetical protein